MQITIFGHASVVVETASTAVLVDPVFADRFASGAIGFHPAKQVDLAALPRMDAIVITHYHLDHWHAPTVASFAPEIPVIVPPDAWLRNRLEALGRRDIRVVRAWERLQIGDLELLATPSDVDFDELGLVFSHNGQSYWHMSDCNVGPEEGRRVREELGSIDVVASRYQPVNALMSYTRGLGWSFDERSQVASWLEAGCATEPRFVFPYFAEIAYTEAHAWANRYACVYSPAMVVDMLRRRLGDDVTVSVVRPGDRLELLPATGGSVEITHRRGASRYVREVPSQPPRWEPVDVQTLAGIHTSNVAELRSRLEGWLRAVFAPWLQAQLRDSQSPARGLILLEMRWMLVIHVGDSEPLAYHIDFRRNPIQLQEGQRDDADYVAHIGAAVLLALLRGEAGTELLYLAGAWRGAERIMIAGRDGIASPPVTGWDLFEKIPEPFSWCLRSEGGTTPPPTATG